MLWFMITLLFALSFIFFSLSVNIRYLYSNLKKGTKATSAVIDKSIEIGKETSIGGILQFTDEMIINSNVKLYITYNVLIHLFLCTLSASMAFIWISQHMNIIISLLFAVLGFLLPYSLLQLLTDYMVEKLKKYSVDFLIILKNYVMATGDIFIAFDKSQSYLVEPLRSYVGIMCYEYKHKINPIVCINNFIKKIGYNDLKLFMENLKIAYVQGSDILMLIDEFTNEISKNNDDSDKEDTEDKILNFGLYMLLLINYLVIYYILNSKYKLEITKSIYGQAVFVADVLISIYIVYLSLRKNH